MRPDKIETHPFRVPDEEFLAIPDNLVSRAKPGLAPETEPFWDGIRAGRLMMQRCSLCGLLTHPPLTGCSHCGGADLTWEQVEPLGTVYTFSVCYLSFGPGLEPPYAAALIELDWQPGLRIVTNLVNTRINDIRIGMRVVGVFSGGDQPLLMFEPATRQNLS